MSNRILAELRRDCWAGVPGAGDPYEWAMRGWMDAAAVGFRSGINLGFAPTDAEVVEASRVLLRLGQIKGVRSSEVVGTPAEVINPAFGLEIVRTSPDKETP